MIPILPLIVLIPFISIIPILALGEKHVHNAGIATAFITFAFSLLAVYLFRAGINLSFNAAYIVSLNLGFSLQLTPFTLILMVMNAIVFLAAAIVSGYFIREKQRMYGTIFAIAEGSAFAVFLSANLFFLYVFWEITEIMVFFIIFIYGGYERRYASFKFIIYSLVSSLLLLVGIMFLYSSLHTFSISSIILNSSSISAGTQVAVLILLLAAFMVKMPVFPLHSWLPDAHTEAPTTGSMILAGVLLKFGGYGLLLLFLMIPLASHYSVYIATIFIVSTIYSAFVSMRQTNLKRAIAYTSITDMGIVAIGISAFNAFGINGALYGMLSHGIAISLLFLIAGTLDELYGTLEISKIKGVVRRFPHIAYLFIFGVVAAVGIPLTSGFIGDILIFIGAVKSIGIASLTAIIGILVIGVMFFWLVERVFMSSDETVPYRQLGRSVTYCSAFLMASTILLGILPSLLLL